MVLGDTTNVPRPGIGVAVAQLARQEPRDRATIMRPRNESRGKCSLPHLN